MSLEKEMKLLRASVEALTAAIVSGPVATPESEEVPEAPAKKKVSKKKAAAKKKAPTKKTGGKKKINYERDVKPKVLIAIATPEGRNAALALFEEYEVKNAMEIDEGDYPEFLEAIDKIIEEHEDEDE